MICLGQIIEFFTNIGDVITSIINFVIQHYKNLLFMYKLLFKFLASIPSFFTWLPSPFMTVLLVIFSVAVIYKILGREG